jgi:hypothetical protein
MFVILDIRALTLTQIPPPWPSSPDTVLFTLYTPPLFERTNCHDQQAVTVFCAPPRPSGSPSVPDPAVHVLPPDVTPVEDKVIL